jgi:hypothetical protein
MSGGYHPWSKFNAHRWSNLNARRQPDGDFYVAERLKQRVQRFSAKGKKKETFIAALPDMPEFLLHVPEMM